tara:strand:+ start:366 stop:1166 length:801 start_codon:yes stop_codon:yes gene_type:complete
MNIYSAKIFFFTIFFIFFCVNLSAYSRSIQSHIAVYELELYKVQSKKINEINGKLVIEVIDSCDGYTQTQRMILKIFYLDGTSVRSDSIQSTWESYDGKVMKFSNHVYLNGFSKELYEGKAVIQEKNLFIHFNLPGNEQTIVKDNVIFPSEHLIELINSAKRGDFILQKRIYDGTGPDGFYDAVAVINTKDKEKKVNKNIYKDLYSTESWWANLAFFSVQLRKETPDYEVGIRLHDNGVVSEFMLNYNDFSVKAQPKRIQYINIRC